MTLPPKAIFALATIRAELLAKNEEQNDSREGADPPKQERKERREITARPRRTGRNAVFQRACRRRDWWTPIG